LARAVVERLAGQLRSGDTLARLGGGQFAILCEDLDEVSQADVIVPRVAEALAGGFTLAGVATEIPAGVRVVFAGLGSEMPPGLLDHPRPAELRPLDLDGRGHGPRRQRLVETRTTTLARDLRGAVRRGELRSDYQPIVDGRDGRIVGVEALLRWDHPTRGLVAPATIVPIAEASGIVVDIERWMLERACCDRHRWVGDTGRDHLGISVNVSARQLLAPDFVEMLTAVLRGTHTSPEQLTLEFTESLFDEGSGPAVRRLEELKEVGVLLALDDFGRGHSSLWDLERFPIDVVKIDPHSVADLAHDRASLAVVSAVTGLAHQLGMVVVAEGVETAAQHHDVTAIGIDRCQGYYFARPMSADDLDQLRSRPASEIDLRPQLSAEATGRAPAVTNHPELFLS
jgi:EAL domain-containing protein (putative c-di-GMP-specific phosphodiesterase class I)